ncbi:hypothetical protein VZ94_00485 [Methylocucumis oryzae]|uniref:Uncharacterized protein n=2 Tax=Methylocucumis oryzae TaxID=1632867 RepID=A0A0F3IMX0_9GAMM|nr:hypothetical protein VZ94_00485 [Methylocucumis oryzae]
MLIFGLLMAIVLMACVPLAMAAEPDLNVTASKIPIKIVNVIFMLGICGVGAIFQYFVSSYKNQLNCSPIEYFFGAIKYTLASIGASGVVVMQMVSDGKTDISDPLILGALFMSGYAIDHVLNKPPAQPTLRMGV